METIVREQSDRYNESKVPKMTVYLVCEGEYENYGPALIASSMDAAVEAIKAEYVSIVAWEPLRLEGNKGYLRGYYATSQRNGAEFDIEPYEVKGIA